MNLLTRITWRWTVSWMFQRAQMKTERCFDLLLLWFEPLQSPLLSHNKHKFTALCFCGCAQTVTLYLVKWCSLPYEDATWELKADIDQSKIDEYERIAARTPNTNRVVSIWRSSLGAVCLPTSSR